MHDGCKRLRDGDWETVGYETDHAATLPTVTKSDQMPVAPSEQKIAFPPGVVSIADWGTTVRLPQVAAPDVTYYELTQMPSQRGYCTWITNHGESKGARPADFARYLKAVGYKKSLRGQKGEERYPRTSEIREKKKWSAEPVSWSRKTCANFEILDIWEFESRALSVVKSLSAGTAFAQGCI